MDNQRVIAKEGGSLQARPSHEDCPFCNPPRKGEEEDDGRGDGESRES